ncbi:MAG: histidine--tRNA ligase [Verrucomicrobiota bacterium]
MTSTPQPVQGMSDLGPPDISLWQSIENTARHTLDLYGFAEVRTPVLEYTNVFTRSLGDTTDVVQKEMYTFEDRGGRSLTLRPEGTAGVIRYLAGLGPEALESRLYYLGPMFRAERPQAGRRRQFHQVGVEALGPANPAADVEVIALQQHLFAAWGIHDCQFEINTRGESEDLKAVADGLKKAVQPHLAGLCEDCRRRFDTNVLRILDCKKEACGKIAAGLPPVTDFMSEPSRKYLEDVLRLLKLLDIKVRVNPRLVRGLDYYVHTVWEIKHSALGAQDALSGGGRYRVDMGGKILEGVGFAIGLERVIAVLEQLKTAPPRAEPRPLVWIVSLGDKAFEENLKLAQTLRMSGVRCGLDLGKGSIKSQMRAANRAGAAQAVIRGDTEMAKGVLLLKSMKDGAQEELELPDLVQRLISAARAG